MIQRLSILVLFFLSACQSHSSKPSVAQAELIGDKGSDLNSIWPVLVQGYDLDYSFNARVKKALRSYLKRPRSLSRQLAQGKPFLYHIVQQLKARQMPLELALLPAIESGFRPEALSHHGAAGLWQFMPATGHYLGLQQNQWWDQRLDLIASTNAALDYLNRLHHRFDDWLLAIAAYNAGGGTIAQAIEKNRQKGRKTDYWSLDLPQETERYVPKLLALSYLIAHAEQYDFDLPPIENKPQWTKVDLKQSIDLKKTAQLLKMDDQTLWRLNASFKQMIAHAQGRYILLPQDKTSLFQSNLDRLVFKGGRFYRVKSGDSLFSISRRYGVSVQELKALNHLSTDRIFIGQKLFLPPSQSVHRIYRVKKGDSLYGIARRFKVQIDDLKKWNRLKNNTLFPGQTLVVSNF